MILMMTWGPDHDPYSDLMTWYLSWSLSEVLILIQNLIMLLITQIYFKTCSSPSSWFEILNLILILIWLLILILILTLTQGLSCEPNPYHESNPHMISWSRLDILILILILTLILTLTFSLALTLTLILILNLTHILILILVWGPDP